MDESKEWIILKIAALKVEEKCSLSISPTSRCHSFLWELARRCLPEASCRSLLQRTESRPKIPGLPSCAPEGTRWTRTTWEEEKHNSVRCNPPGDTPLCTRVSIQGAECLSVKGNNQNICIHGCIFLNFNAANVLNYSC